MQSGAVMTVAKESGQATLTLLPMNLAKMVARAAPGLVRERRLADEQRRAAVPVHPEQQQPDPVPALRWRPRRRDPGLAVRLAAGPPDHGDQHAKSFTSQGDISLVDLTYYQAITKAEGIQTDTSMHLYFDADAMAFRTTFRMDGQSKLAAAITPANGSNTLSPFVQLGAR
jgi:hypothetical protein